MSWNEAYSRDCAPTLEEIDGYIASPLWLALRGFIEENFSSRPSVQHSICSGAPGWNVKYKKSGRALCTLYPQKGHFVCLVCIGNREAAEMSLLVNTLTPYVRSVYQEAGSLNGTRWLMIDVTDEHILADVQKLLCLRARPAK